MSRREPAHSSRTDWEDVRRRLEATARSLDQDTELSSEAVRELLELRARALARPEATPAAHAIAAVTFELAGETYAIATNAVAGIFPLAALTPLPAARPWVLGITEWRGDLLTLLDLRRLLGLPGTRLDDLRMVIVLGNPQPVFGLLADSMGTLATIVTADLHVPEPDAAASKAHVLGLTADAVVLLDAQSLLKLSHVRRD